MGAKMDIKKMTIKYVYLAVPGFLIWGATLLGRDMGIGGSPIVDFILGVAPNFGAVFAFTGLSAVMYQNIRKKAMDPKYLPAAAGAILGLGLLSEIFHHFFLDSPFDIWDIVISILAFLVILLISRYIKKD